MSDLIITGILDGPLSGGTPKTVELFALADIPDLSMYGLGVANNGLGTDGEEFTLSGSVNAGEYLYVSLESAGFQTFLGFAPDFDNASAIAFNGDDAVELFMNGTVVDVFGDVNVDGTGQPWDYTDGWAYRVPDTSADGSTFNLSNWTFSGADALEGETTNATAVAPFPIGTFDGMSTPNPLVNDAPVLLNDTTFTTIAANVADTANTGDSVTDLIEGLVSDADFDAIGIAVTEVDNANGTWQYSDDGGTIWQALDGSASDTNAVTLGATSLYSGYLGTAPASQNQLSLTSINQTDPIAGPQAVETVELVSTTLDTTADPAIYAGYSTYTADPVSPVLVDPTFASLDNTRGYSVSFNLQLLEESRTNESRAGFSILAVSEDTTKAIELGFQQTTDTSGNIFAQGDGANLFIAEENVAFNTNDATSYTLTVLDDSYQLAADGSQILSGSLRDYSAFAPPPGIADPYELPSHIFLGDNSTSAQGRFALNTVAVEPETRVRFVPNADYNGEAAIRFRAWDTTDGSSNGETSVDASQTGGSAAFSTNVVTGVLTVEPEVVDPTNEPPVLTNLDDDTAAFFLGGGPVVLDVGGDAIATDSDSADFDGGTLAATIANRVVSQDLLTLDTAGPVSATGTTAGSTISVGETAIATLANDIATGSDLVLTLNASATPTTVSTLIQALQYQNTATTTPDTTTRFVNITLSDGDGGTSAVNTVNVTFGTAPEIDVLGNGTPIASGDTTPDLADGTNFGTKLVDNGSIINTFEIANLGSTDLILSGTPLVSISESPHFSITAQPSGPAIAPTASDTFEITFDPAAPGFHTATVTIANDDSDENPYTFDVQGYGVPDVVINEIDVDTPGADVAEFIELYDGGIGNTPLDGLAIVLYDGFNDASYGVFDLDGFSTDADGYFVLGNAAIAAAGLTFANGTLQNGPDAIALQVGDTEDFPIGTPVSSSVVDAVVYSTDGVDDPGLLPLLNTGQLQVNENAGEQSATQSLQRLPNGEGGNRNTSSFVTAAPTPGAANAATIQFESDAFTSPENGGISTSVTLVRGSAVGESTVQVDITGGTATDNSSGEGDYVSTGFPLTVTFADGESSQTIEIPLIDDLAVEGDETITLALSNPVNGSLGGRTTTLLTLTDDDVAGFAIAPSDGTIEVDESGTTDTVTVVLESQPVSNVELTVSSSDPGEAIVTPTILTFTPADWDQPQTVTVTGADDGAVDGPQTSTVTVAVNPTTSAAAFASLPAQTVTVTTRDNDSAGIFVSQSGETTAVVEGGAVDGYTVVLGSQPSADVAIALSSDGQTSLSSSTLTFTPANWNQAQTVTVTAVDDDLVEGPHTSTITHRVSSSDASYNGLAVQDVTVAITDNDNAGIAIDESGGTTTVTEGGATDGYTLVLTSQPTTDVTIALSTNGQVALGTSTVTFTPANWNQARTVTVSAVDDAIAEGPHSGIITHSVSSGDSRYDGLAIADVTVAITDNDTASVSITQSGGSTFVTEAGGTDGYTVVLNSQPTADVVITLAADDQTTVSPTSLTFSPTNWNQAQTVAVSAIDDLTVEGTHASIIAHSIVSGDASYNGIAIPDVAVTIADNDIAGVSVSPGSVTVSEDGTVSESILITLDAAPAGDVVFDISSSDPEEVTVDQPRVTLNSTNWETGIAVQVLGVDDAVDDGDQISTLTVAVDASSSDSAFVGLEPQTVEVTTLDNDIAGLTVSGAEAAVSEDGATDTLEISLTAEPTAEVILAFDGGTQLETPEPLTFTPENWDQFQTITIAAIDDDVDEGDHTGEVVISLSSNDPGYNGLEVPPISVTIEDNDRPPELVFDFEQFIRFQQLNEGVNPIFDPELYLIANPDVQSAIESGAIASAQQHYEQFGLAEGRSLLPLSLEIGRLRMADFYDETFYLAQNSDAAEAVAQGAFAYGLEHFLRFGLGEGRSPSSFYNEALYLENNPDIARAIADGLVQNGLTHYIQFGHIENRIASELFDPEEYLLNNPDVQAAVSSGALASGFEHYLESGADEGRLPGLLYVENSYLTQNPDVANAIAAGAFDTGYEHFVSFGQTEGRDPGSVFDESAYLNANPDVAEAVANGTFASGFEHYFRAGRAENRLPA